MRDTDAPVRIKGGAPLSYLINQGARLRHYRPRPSSSKAPITEGPPDSRTDPPRC
jgi:hypothetical protein